MKSLTGFFLFILIHLNIQTQVSLQWDHTLSYFGMQTGNGVCMLVDSTNIPLVLGQQWNWEQTPLFHLYKLNPATGVVLWDRTSGQMGQFLFLDRHNNAYVCGRKKTGFTWENPFLAKYTPGGTLIFNVTENFVPQTELYAAWLDLSANSYLLMKYFDNFKISKFDSAGNLSWTKLYGDHNNINSPKTIITDNNTDLIVSGIVVRSSVYYITLLRLNSAGNILDTSETVLTGATSASIGQTISDPSGNIYLMGNYNGPGSQRKYIFSKYSPGFVQLWSKTDTAESTLPNSKFILLRDGSIIRKNITGLLKYDSSGSQLWSINTAWIRDIKEGSDNNVYATGSSGTNYYTCKIDPNGNLLWQITRFYTSYSSTGLSIAVDSGNYVYVHGTSSAGGPVLIVTLKYSQLSGINETGTNIPLETRLLGNYPNPFNPLTKIDFTIRNRGEASLMIFDIRGKEIFRFEHSEIPPGSYTYEWNGENYSSGIYFVKLVTAGHSETKKMILLK